MFLFLLSPSSCQILLQSFFGFSFLATLVFAELDNETSPTSLFRSRPDLHAPIVDLEFIEPEYVSPGYIFLTPYRNLDPGPYIYDNEGQLVWSGAGTQGASTAHNLHVCQYQGKDHLCFFQGHQQHGWARGHGVIMNNHYRVVKTVEAAGAASTIDMHEFRLINGGKSALVTIYQPRQYDLGDYGIGPGMGWIHDSLFQEIDVETGELIFEWRSLDHISPSFTYTCAACTDTSGDGLSQDTPWDFFHINSIDKNADGDYLISARHVAAIYKISGRDGHIMWELNGANPTFRNTKLHFSSQHHALWVHENRTHTVISLFDNASNTFNNTNGESRGMLVEIDHIERTAYKIKEWRAPEPEGILSGSQGNFQQLPNGNAFIGWGDHAFYSEHLDTGEAVMYGKLAYWGSDVMIYRANKYPWVGEPLTTPSLWTYSLSANLVSDMLFYVSWNGATEVCEWRLYIGDSASGPFELAAVAPKKGFETEFRIAVTKQWSYAEAVDAHGDTLRRSGIVKTFIPSEAIKPLCDDRGCAPVPPLAEGEFFDKTMPKVPNRGENYTRGYTTSNYYYLNLPSGSKLRISKSPTSTGLVVLSIAAVVLLLWRRRAMRTLSGWQELVQEHFHKKPGKWEGDGSVVHPDMMGRKYRRLHSAERDDYA